MFDKGWFNNPDILALWVHLLFKANHKDTEVFIGLNKIPIKRGQFITSRQHLSVESGIEQSKVERILNMLKTEHQIEQQSFNKFRMITITNWDKYQTGEQQNEQQMNNKRTANEQQMNTDNNDKNDKNEKKKKNIYGEYHHVLLTDEQYQKLKEKFGNECDAVINNLDEGIELKGYKYKNHYLAILKWNKDIKQKPKESSWTSNLL